MARSLWICGELGAGGFAVFEVDEDFGGFRRREVLQSEQYQVVLRNLFGSSCLESLSQRQDRAADSGLYGAERVAGHFCDLGVGKTIEESHFQSFALLRRQLQDEDPRFFHHQVAFGFVGEIAGHGEIAVPRPARWDVCAAACRSTGCG